MPRGENIAKQRDVQCKHTDSISSEDHLCASDGDRSATGGLGTGGEMNVTSQTLEQAFAISGSGSRFRGGQRLQLAQPSRVVSHGEAGTSGIGSVRANGGGWR